MIRTKPALPPLPKIQLDWRGYFLEFSRLHGGDPVPFKGRLLWRDGWRYSATDYRGPEIPPPSNDYDCRRLIQMYWRVRLTLINRQRRDLAEQLVGLEETASSRSAPLQAWRLGRDDAGKRSVLRGELELQAVRDRLEFLRSDAIQCEKELTSEKERQR